MQRYTECGKSHSRHRSTLSQSKTSDIGNNSNSPPQKLHTRQPLPVQDVKDTVSGSLKAITEVTSSYSKVGVMICYRS